MDGQLRSLRLLRGDRRSGGRANADREEPIVLCGSVGNLQIERAQVQALEFGRVVLKVPVDVFPRFETLIGEFPVELRNGAVLFMTGSWRMLGSRLNDDGGIVVLEHPDAEVLKPLEDTLDVGVLNRGDRLRIMYTDRDTDLEELERHFTDMADFPTTVPCVIRFEGEHRTGHFSFEAKSRVLDELHLQVAELSSLAPGMTVRFEYTFFTVRYVALVEIKDVDQDFELLVLKFPPWIAALTSRRFDRRVCNLDVSVQVSASEEAFDAKMTSFSIAGGNLLFQEPRELKVGAEITLTFTKVEVSIAGVVCSSRKNAVGFSFSQPEEECGKIRKVFCSTISAPFVVRDSSNTGLFEEIYRQVGYGPKDVKDELRWLEKTRQCWQFQDRAIPGNMIGAGDGNGLSIAMGILPYGERLAYSHSMAMDRSIDSIKNFFDVSSMNLAFTSLLEHVTHFIGTAKTKSRFSTRIHTCFECHAKMQTQTILYALSVAGGADQPDPERQLYEISSSPIGPWSLPEDIQQMVSLLATAHPALSEAHQIRHYQICDRATGGLMAWVIGHRSPELFTAVNMFNLAMCFLVNKEADIDQVYQAMLTENELRGLAIEFFGYDRSKVPAAPNTERPYEDVFWWIFDKEEMGPILASLSRSAWSVMKKYGDELRESIKRFAS